MPRLAKPQAAELALTTTPPPGTGRVPAGRERFYGSLDVGGKALPFVMAKKRDQPQPKFLKHRRNRTMNLHRKLVRPITSDFRNQLRIARKNQP